MEMRLVKKLVALEDKATKEKKEFYTFYLQLPNGMQLRILPNSYKDSNGTYHSNYQQLVLVADDEFPFDKK